MSNNNNIENEIKNNFKINLFDFNKIFEIDYDLDKIINYVLKKGNFLQNNRQINIKKIEEEYKEDYKRNCGFKERLDSVITISFDDLKKKLQIEYGKKLYEIILIGTQAFIGFFFNQINEQFNFIFLRELIFDKLHVKFISNNRYSYFDKSYNKIEINEQKYYVLYNTEQYKEKENQIINFQYKYKINIEENTIKFIYKINIGKKPIYPRNIKKSFFSKKIIELLKVINNIKKKFYKDKKISIYFNTLLKKIIEYKYPINTNNNIDNIINKLSFYINICNNIYQYYDKNNSFLDYISKNKYQINSIENFIKKDFLIINFNEDKNDFYDYNLKDILFRISIQEPSFIIVCTQNSKTNGKMHFQHILKEELKNNYELLIKNSTIKHIRTRIYYKKNNITNKSDNINKFYIKEKEIVEYKDKKYGNGLIYLKLEISYQKIINQEKKSRLFKFIFLNCNLTENREYELNNILNIKFIDEYNIFLLGYINFPFKLQKGNKVFDISPINMLVNYNLNKKKFYNNYINNDELYTFLDGKIIKSETSSMNKKKNNEIKYNYHINNFIQSLKKLGFHITYSNFFESLKNNYDENENKNIFYIFDIYILINNFINKEIKINLNQKNIEKKIIKEKINLFIDIYKIIIKYGKLSFFEDLNLSYTDFHIIFSKILALKIFKLSSNKNIYKIINYNRVIFINKHINIVNQNINKYKTYIKNGKIKSNLLSEKNLQKTEKLLELVKLIDNFINILNKSIFTMFNNIKILQLNRFLYSLTFFDKKEIENSIVLYQSLISNCEYNNNPITLYKQFLRGKCYNEVMSLSFNLEKKIIKNVNLSGSKGVVAHRIKNNNNNN